jgi:tRNA 5-methylaminomethyl-2-thiouridine biosynthesis bifunctional protein
VKPHLSHPLPLIPARLAWAADGTPYSAAYDDIYHSSDGGLGQARHVFLGGSGLLGDDARWRGRERFVIVETGFGLGLNFLATWQAWRDADIKQNCAQLHFISFEKHPFSATDLAQLHARWPELAPCAAALQAQWPTLTPGAHRLSFDDGQVILTLFFGDANELLPKLRAHVDAFYLDGFAPGKNPDLWSPRIYSSLARLAVSGATLATWCLANPVQRALAATGFLLDKPPGFGGRREMLRGVFRVERRTAPPRPSPAARHAIVIGAGLAGCAMAERLASRGWQITLIDAAAAPAQGASGNHAGILRPLPSHDDNLLARLTRAGFLHLRRHLQSLAERGQAVRWQDCGVLHLARDPLHESTQRELIEHLQPPSEFLRFLERDAARAIARWPVAHGGWWFPGGGWVQPASLCRAHLDRCGARLTALFGIHIARHAWHDGQWQIYDAQNQCIARAPTLILANAQGARTLLETADDTAHLSLPLRPARGQVTHLAADALPAPEVVICRLGYVTPVIDGIRSAGASFIADDTDTTVREADHQDNLSRLEFSLPGALAQLTATANKTNTADTMTMHPGRAAVRSMTQDRLPLVGALPVGNTTTPFSALDEIPRQPGLYGLLGFGARGLVWSALAAELLASQINGEPLPVENDLAAAIDPARFLLRREKARRRD